MYLKYFGFREAPFNLTPDPSFFYDSALHREALAALYYGIKSKKGFIVVTGEVGTGKTTLLRKLLRNLEATHHSVYVFNTLLTFDELLEYAVRDLGMEPAGRGRAALVQQLNEFLLEKTKTGHIVSLLIDEAQQLSEEALEAIRFLSNLETDRDKLIQIILVGQPELEAKLNRPSLRQLKQRVSIWSRLDRLSPKDTETYIRHRLDMAGYRGPDLFDASSISLICEHSTGTPRLINSICDNALLTAFAVSEKIVSAEIIYEVIRDLRLTRDSDAANFVWPERKEMEQSAPKAIRNIPELGDRKGSAKRRGQEEPPERLRTESSIPAPGVGDVVYNLGLKSDQAHVRRDSYERDFKRLPAKTISTMAEIKDRRSGERVMESDEVSAIEVNSRERGFLGRRYGSAPQRVNEAFVASAFFSKMAQTLTDAMGPMASLILKEKIARLGEPVEQFPAVRLPELVTAVKQEILSEGLRRRFEEEITAQIQEHSKSVVWRSSAK